MKENILTTSEFAIPPPTLLIQGNSILDQSPNKFVPINNNGDDVPVSSDVTLFGQQSLEFGNNRRINFGTQIPSPDTEEFTIEAWIYPFIATTSVILTVGQGYYSKEFFIGLSGNYLLCHYNGYNNRFGATTPVVEANKWQHIAVLRENKSALSTLSIFIDSQLTTSVDIPLGYSIDQWVTQPFAIGDRYANAPLNQYPFLGCIYSLRYTRGFCLYKENFNVPDSPFKTY